ncbi:MAG: branched-chain amino acid transport system substrate-binding protein, partial [Frankiales bacterium]|nr:branched-chain amino acid transport system substrate-binding protein [Frankiales bacterium]
SRSVPVALAVGLLIGALVTALLVGGTKAQLATVSGDAADPGAAGASQTAAPGQGLAPTGPVGGASRPGSPGAGGLQSGAGGGGPAQGNGDQGRPQTNILGIDCAKLQTPGVRGITPTTIKIGVGLADLDALKPLYGDAVTFGPQEQIFDAVFKGNLAQGALPCGRHIVPVYQKYQVLTESQSRAVCQSFMNDEKVFAVITTFSFRDPLCITQENKSFLIDEGYQIYQTQVAQSGGRLFSLHPPVDLWYRIWTNWVITRLANQPGVKFGVYYNTTDPLRVAVVEKDILKVLKAHGITPVIATSDASAAALITGDPNDTSAVLKFKNEHVTHVMMSVENFMKEAQRQSYHPQYFFAGTDAEDANAGRFDPDNGDGAQGLTWDRINDYHRGVKPSADQEQCVGYTTKAGIARPRQESGQWELTMIACDEVGIVVRAIRAAGANLTTNRLALGARTVTSWPGNFVGRGGYTDKKSYLVNENREARYSKDCSCWKTTGDWKPLFLGR